MKNFSLFLFFLLFACTKVFAHPIKLTASLIEYDAKTNSLKMECKVFVDDFQNTIKNQMNTSITPSKLSEVDRSAIEKYFNQYYVLKINGVKQELKFLSSELKMEYNVLTIRFTMKKIMLKKGDKVYVANMLFFKEFGETQSNRVTFRIPPFFDEYTDESIADSPIISFDIE